MLSALGGWSEMTTYASDEKGPLYVVSTQSWEQVTLRLVNAASLREAKTNYGRMRQAHTSVAVRRATPVDVERIRGVR